jgi:hypothetical protein
MAGGVVFLRPFLFQERFGPAIVSLLIPKRPHRVATMVPTGGRIKA